MRKQEEIEGGGLNILCKAGRVGPCRLPPGLARTAGMVLRSCTAHSWFEWTRWGKQREDLQDRPVTWPNHGHSGGKNRKQKIGA